MSDARLRGQWRARGGGGLRGVLVDVTPLREHAAYRRLWAGGSLSFLGTQVTAVAVPLQVYELTRSSFAVGMVGAAAILPLVGFGLLGGAIADTFDRRRVLLVTSTGLALVSAVLTVQAITGARSLAVLYGCVAVQAGFAAVDSPTGRATVPRLVPPEQLPAALNLQHVLVQGGVLGGPLLAGILVAGWGAASAYAFDTVTFLAALYAAWRLPALHGEADPTSLEAPARARVASVAEGLRFLRARPTLLMTFLVDLAAMVLAMPRALFPALAVGLGGGPRAAGLLYAAPAAGALVAGVFGGWLGGVRRQGRAVLLAVVTWGLAMAAFGLADALAFGVLMLAVAGAADMVSAVFRSTILQVATPDALRGRLSAVFIVVVTGGPRLGDVTSGTLAALTSPPFAVVAGGLGCVATVLILRRAFPSFARYDASAPPG